MSCAKCIKPDAPRVTLIDGRQVCSWCEEWRHECEARAILKISPLARRRAHLFGTPGWDGQRKGGIEQRRGEAELKRLQNTMTAIWKQRQQA